MKFRGSLRGLSRAARWRRTCKQRDRAWARSGLGHVRMDRERVKGDGRHTLLLSLNSAGLGLAGGSLLLGHFGWFCGWIR